jgi:hypothetical protein
LIPRPSLISGRIGEPSHSQPNPWKELSQLAPAGEQIAQFGGKKAVQIQQPIADQNGGSRSRLMAAASDWIGCGTAVSGRPGGCWSGQAGSGYCLARMRAGHG